MKEVVIVSACRTAIGAFGGTLKDLNGATIASVTMKEAVKRAGIDPGLIDDVRYGTCIEHHDTLNTTRVAALESGTPDTVPAATINRVCISGMEATLSGAAMIHALHCGPHLQPLDETTPLDTEQAPALFYGQTLYNGTHSRICGPAPEHQPGMTMEKLQNLAGINPASTCPRSISIIQPLRRKSY